MTNEKLLRTSATLLFRSRTVRPRLHPGLCQSVRHAHNQAIGRGSVIASSGLRPQVQSRRNLAPFSNSGDRWRRTIFIQTQETPNVDALKFLPNHRVIPESISSPYIEYLNPRSTIAPPYPSPLAAQLMSVDGVTSVFYSADCITVTKAADAHWAHIKPEVYSLITETVTSGQPIITVSTEGGAPDAQQQVEEEDSLAYNENDSEVVGMIKELLDTRIRPRIQEDGGDIEYRGFDDDGNVLLKLRGACRTCDSSTVTLKNGIEAMLMHYIEEVKGVVQITDPEEDIALHEFEKFEEKLRAQKGSVPPSTVGKDSLDSVPG